MKNKIMIFINALIISAIFVLNYFYQSNRFDFTLKCICSGSFALLGIINLVYSFVKKQGEKSFYFTMTAGLILAFLGDVFIGYDFIIGAATFALGHICFVVAYCLLDGFNKLDLILSSVLSAGSIAFLLFFPMLKFENPVFRIVCIVYALIISFMLGKAVGNFIKNKSFFTGTVAFASALFFFSDLMLVLDWFIGRWSWTDHACMGTYYPALCFLALSMLLKINDKKNV